MENETLQLQHKRNTVKGKTSMDGHNWTKLKLIAFG